MDISTKRLRIHDFWDLVDALDEERRDLASRQRQYSPMTLANIRQMDTEAAARRFNLNPAEVRRIQGRIYL